METSEAAGAGAHAEVRGLWNQLGLFDLLDEVQTNLEGQPTAEHGPAMDPAGEGEENDLMMAALAMGADMSDLPLGPVMKRKRKRNGKLHPVMGVLMDRYGTKPQEGKKVSRRTLNRLSDPVLGKVTKRSSSSSSRTGRTRKFEQRSRNGDRGSDASRPSSQRAAPRGTISPPAVRRHKRRPRHLTKQRGQRTGAVPVQTGNSAQEHDEHQAAALRRLQELRDLQELQALKAQLREAQALQRAQMERREASEFATLSAEHGGPASNTPSRTKMPQSKSQSHLEGGTFLTALEDAVYDNGGGSDAVIDSFSLSPERSDDADEEAMLVSAMRSNVRVAAPAPAGAPATRLGEVKEQRQIHRQLEQLHPGQRRPVQLDEPQLQRREGTIHRLARAQRDRMQREQAGHGSPSVDRDPSPQHHRAPKRRRGEAASLPERRRPRARDPLSQRGLSHSHSHSHLTMPHNRRLGYQSDTSPRRGRMPGARAIKPKEMPVGVSRRRSASVSPSKPRVPRQARVKRQPKRLSTKRRSSSRSRGRSLSQSRAETSLSVSPSARGLAHQGHSPGPGPGLGRGVRVDAASPRQSRQRGLGGGAWGRGSVNRTVHRGVGGRSTKTAHRGRHSNDLHPKRKETTGMEAHSSKRPPLHPTRNAVAAERVAVPGSIESQRFSQSQSPSPSPSPTRRTRAAGGGISPAARSIRGAHQPSPQHPQRDGAPSSLPRDLLFRSQQRVLGLADSRSTAAHLVTRGSDASKGVRGKGSNNNTKRKKKTKKTASTATTGNSHDGGMIGNQSGAARSGYIRGPSHLAPVPVFSTKKTGKVIPRADNGAVCATTSATAATVTSPTDSATGNHQHTGVPKRVQMQLDLLARVKALQAADPQLSRGANDNASPTKASSSATAGTTPTGLPQPYAIGST